MNTHLTPSVAAAVSRRFGQLVKPVTFLVALTLGLGGVSLVQSWMSSQTAHALDGTVTWIKPLTWEFTADAVYGVGDSVDPTAPEGRVWEVRAPGSATPTIDSYYTSGGIYSAGEDWSPTQIGTMAIAPDMTQAERPLVAYHWPWGTEGTVSSHIPVKKVVPGQVDAAEAWAPYPIGAVWGWDAGAGIQGTGEIIFATTRLADLNNRGSGGYRMMICNPAKLTTVTVQERMQCRRSGDLRPATPADQLTPGGLTGTWYAAAGMAMDAEGNAFLLVGRQDVKHLIKVIPGADGRSWEWRKQVEVFKGPGLTQAEFDEIRGVEGMAAVDGKLYTRISDTVVGVIDPLTGIYDRATWDLPEPATRDFASAQTTALIRGHVYIDQSGQGVISEADKANPANAAAGQTVELYRPGDPNTYTTVTDGTGEYNFLISDIRDSTWYVRLVQPQVNGYNALQTWAAGYATRLTIDSNIDPITVPGTRNTVTTRCQGVEAPGMPDGTACFGARTDGVDPSTGVTSSNVFTATGAEIVAKVEVQTESEVSVVDFGITLHGSYGDAPAGFKTTRAQDGPLSFPRAGGHEVYLGALAGDYADGTNDPAAAAHGEDDGLEFRGTGTGTYLPLQDQLLVVGGRYDFRAKLTGAGAANGFAKAWFAELASDGTASTTFPNTPVMGATQAASVVEADGYVYLYNYQVPDTRPQGGLQDMLVRARAGWDAAANYTAVDNYNHEPVPGDVAYNTRSWAQSGEVEDYRMSVAEGAVRMEARTLGGVSSKFDFSLTNVLTTPPSSNSTSIITNASEDWAAAPNGHAFATLGSAVTITAQNIPQGWRISDRTDTAGQPLDTYCYDQVTGLDVDYELVLPTTLTLKASAVQLGADVVCRVTFVPIGNVMLAVLTTTPTPDAANPLLVTLPAEPGEEYALEATLTGSVADEHGVIHDIAVPATAVRMSLTPVTASGASATGAWFTDNNLQSATCETGAAGTCVLYVQASRSGTYTVTAQTPNPLGVMTNFPTVTTPADKRHPAELYFEAGEVCDPPWADTFNIDNAGTKYANGADTRTGTIKLEDCGHNPVTGKTAADFAFTVLRNVGGPTLIAGTDYWIEDLAESATKGTYTFTIRTVRFGNLQVTATYDPTGTNLTLGTKPATFEDPGTVCIEGDPDPRCNTYSTFDIAAKTPMPYADWQFTQIPNSDWGYYEGTITLVGFFDNPVVNGIGRITMLDDTQPPSAPEGAKFWPDGNPPAKPAIDAPMGVVCSEPLTDGRCETGVYTIRIYSTKVGVRAVSAMVSQAGAPNDIVDTKPAEFRPRSHVDFDQTKLVITPSPNPLVPVAPDGTSPYSATVTVTDENGVNELEGAVITWSIAPDVSAPAGGGATMRDATSAVLASGGTTTTTADGTTTVTITAVIPEGNYLLSATYGGNPVGQPAALPANQKSPQVLYFATGDVDPDKSLIWVDQTPVVANNTDTVTLRVKLFDAGDLPVSGKAARLSASGPAGIPLTFSAFTETGTSGVYYATVKSTKSGSFNIQFWLDATTELLTKDTDPYENVTAHFLPDLPCDPIADPTNCPNGALKAELKPTVPLDGSHPRVYADGADSYTVTVTLADANGNPVTDWAGTKVSREVAGTPATATADWDGPTQVGADSGIYELFLTSEDIASFLLTLGYDPSGSSRNIPFVNPPGNEAVFGAGPPCTIPGTSSFALDAGPKYSQDPTSYYSAEVVLMDCQRRPITDALTNPNAMLNLNQASGTPGAISVQDLVQSATSGTYTAKIFGEAAGSYTVDVDAMVGTAPTGTLIGTEAAEFVPAGADWTKSYFDATPTTDIPAGENGTITLYVFNSADQPANLTPAELAAVVAQAVKDGGGADATVTLPFVSTGTTGVYTANVTTTVPGAYLVSVWHTLTVPSTNIALKAGGNDTLTWVAGPVDPQRTVDSLTTKPTTTRDDGDDTGWAQVILQDEHGNPVKNTSGVCFVFMYDAPGFTRSNDGPRWIDNPANKATAATTGPTQVCGDSDDSGVVRFEAVSIVASPTGTPGFEVRARYYDTALPGGFVENNVTAPDGYPRYLHFSRTPIDYTKSWFTVEQTDPLSSDVIANGSDSYTVRVFLRDADNNPVRGGSVELRFEPDPALTGDQPVPSGGTNFLSDADGLDAKTVSSTVDGTWTIRVLAGADELSLNTPSGSVKSADLTFKWGAPWQYKLADPGYYSFADGVDSQLITAEVRDQYGIGGAGNLVPGATVVFHVPSGVAARCQESGGTYTSGITTLTCTTGDGTGGTARGVAGLQVVSDEPITGPTEYDITAQAGTPLVWITAGSPAKARFKPGNTPSPVESTLEITSTDPKTAGVEMHVGRITIRDSAGNVITADEDQATVVLEWRLVGSSGPWQQLSDVTTDGWVDIEFTDQVAGTYDVRALVGSQVMSYAAGSRQTVVFSPGPPVWANSDFDTSKNAVLANGVATHSAWVIVRDQFNNTVPNVPIRFTVDQGAPDVAGPWFGTPKNDLAYIDGVTGPNGRWEVEIRSEEPGSFDVTAASGTNRIPNAQTVRTIQFTAGEADPNRSYWEVDPDPAALSTKVLAGPGGGSYTVTVTAVSVYGILVDAVGVRLNITDPLLHAAPGNTGITGTPTNPEWGKYTFTVTADQPGSYPFPAQVMTNNGWVTITNPSSEIVLKFVAGKPDQGSSWLVEPGVPAVAGSNQTVSAFVNDSSGFPVEDGTVVTFTIPAGVVAKTAGGDVAGPTTVSVPTVGGQASLVVVSETATTQAGAYQINATAGTGADEIPLLDVRQVADPSVSVRSDGNVWVWWTPGPVDPVRTLESLATEQGAARADGSQTRWARITVQDQFGNPVANQEVCFVLMWNEPGPGNLANGPRWGTDALTGPTVSCLTSGATGVLEVYARSYYASPLSSLDGYVVKGRLELNSQIYWSADSPAKKVAFSNDAPVAEESDWDVAPTVGNPTPGKVVADGSDSFTVTANLRNALGNPVFQGNAVVTVTPVSALGSTIGGPDYTITSDGSGVAVVSFASLMAGSYRVTVSIGSDLVPTPVKGSGVFEQIIVFAPGPVSDKYSSLTWPVNSAVANGVETQVITATVRDEFGAPGVGNLVGGASVVFDVPLGTWATGCTEGMVTGSASAVCTVVTGSAGANLGLARLTLRSTIADTYEVEAVADGVQIKHGSPAEAVFVAGPVDPDKSTLEIVTLPGVKTVGEDHVARVTIRDAFNNVIVASTGQVNVSLAWVLATDSSVSGSAINRPTVGGVVEIPFTATVAGVYVVSATVPTGEVGGSGVQVEFVAGTPTQGRLAASGGRMLNDGVAYHTGTITVRDAYSNVVPLVPVVFSVTGDAVLQAFDGTGWVPCSPDPQYCELTTSSAGQAGVRVVNHTNETVLLYAEVPGTSIVVVNSPAPLEFGPGGSDPGNSTLTVAQSDLSATCVVADGVESWTATVELRDAAGLLAGGQSVSITATSPVVIDPVAVGGLYTTPVSGAMEGMVEVRLTSTSSGTFSVSAMLGNSHITDSPASIAFCAGPMDPDVSFLTAPVVNAVANGTSPQTIMATVLDKFANPLVNTTVVFEVPDGTWVQGTTISGPNSYSTTTNGSGEATVTLVSTVAGTYDVTAAVGGVDIRTGSPAQAVFVAGPVDYDNSTIEVLGTSPKVADGVEYYTVRVTLLDEFNNPVIAEQNRPVTLTFENGATVLTRYPTVNASAQALYQFSTTVAGTWQVSAEFNSTPIAGGQKLDMLFVPGEPDLSESVFEVSGTLVLADGVQAHWARVVLKDTNGNTIPGRTIRFEVTQGAASVPGPWFGLTNNNLDWATGVTDANGVALVEIRSDEPGAFLVSATYGGDGINFDGDTRGIGFTSGTADPDMSWWEVVPDPLAPATLVRPNDNDTYEVTLFIRSASNLKVDGASVRLDLSAHPNLSITQTGTEWVTGTPTIPEWGQFTFNVKSTLPGIFEFPAQVNVNSVWLDIPHPQPLVTLQFKAGKPDQGSSWLVEPGVPARVGEVQTITAHVNDSSGFPVEDGTVVTFTIPAGVVAKTAGGDVAGPTTVSVPTVGGQATLEVVSSTPSDEAGAAKITATAGTGADEVPLGNVRRANQPTVNIRTDGEVWVWWTLGDPDPDQSVLTIPTATGGSTRVANNIQFHTAQVDVADAAGQPIPNVSVYFTFNPVGLAPESCTAVSNSSGVATCNFTSTVAGEVTVHAYLGTSAAKDEVSDSPATAQFVAGPVDPQKTVDSLETEPGAARADGTQTRWARMTAQDEFGNPVEGETVCFYMLWPSQNKTQGPRWTNARTGPVEVCGTSGPSGVVEVKAVSLYDSPDDSPDGYEVKGKMDVGGTTYNSQHSKKVAYTTDAPLPANSDWAVAPTTGNPDATKVVANGSDSYTVSVNLRNADGDPVDLASAVVIVTPVGTIGAPYTVVSNVNGEGTVLIRSDVAGTFTIRVEVGGAALANSSSGAYEETITFAAGPPSALNSELTSPLNAAVADGSDQQVIVATVRDAFGANGQGNLISGATVRFTVPLGTVASGCQEGTVAGSASAVCTKLTGSTGANQGVARLVLTSNVAGNYNTTATAQVGANPTVAITKGSPGVARFTAGPADPGTSTFEITTTGAMRAGLDYHNARITIRDADNNLITDPTAQVEVEVRWSLATDPTHGGSAVLTTVGGVINIPFTDTKAGDYNVTAFISGGQVGTTRVVTFSAGPAAKVTMTTTGGRVLNDGLAAHRAWVLVTDQYDNPVGNTNVEFSVTGSARLNGAVSPVVRATSTVTGITSIDITDLVAESVMLTASVGSLTVTGSPATLLFGTGVVQPGTSNLTVAQTNPTAACVVANGLDSWTATVTLRNAAGQPVPAEQVGILADSPVTINPVGLYLTNASGQVVVTLRSEQTGTFDVSAMIGLVHVSQSPQSITFCAGPMDQNVSSLIAPAAAAVADNVDTQVVTAIVKDAKGNPISGATVNFAVPAGTTAVGTASPTTNANGVATLTLRSTVAGSYYVTAAVAGVQIRTGSPAKVTFVPGPIDYQLSRIWKSETGPMTANGVASYTVNVALVDAYNNPITNQIGKIVTLNIALGGLEETRALALEPNGRVSTQFATTKAGNWQATATVNGLAIEGPTSAPPPVPLLFQAGPPDVAASEFTVSGSLALSDGLEFQWAKVVLTDKFGNPVANQTIRFQVTQGSPTVPGPWFGLTNNNLDWVNVTTNADGVAYVEIRSNEPGAFDVTASWNSQRINHATDVRPIGFTAGSPDPAKSRWWLTPVVNPTDNTTWLQADGADQYTIRIEIKSNYDLLVDNAPVRLDLTGLTGLALVETGTEFFTGTPTTGTYGEFTFHVTSTKSGVFEVPVQVFTGGTWQNIENPAPKATLRFKSGPPSSTNTWLVEPDPATVGDTMTITVKSVDENGNPVDNGSAIIHVPVATCPNGGGRVFDNEGPVEVPFVNGEASLTLEANCAGSWELTADVKEDGSSTPEPISMVKDASATDASDPDLRTDGTVTVTFNPDGIGEGVLTIPTAVGGATKVADGVEQHRAEVAVTDQTGTSPVPNAPVRFYQAVGANGLTAPTTWPTTYTQVNTGANGVAVLPISTTVAGWVWIKAEVQLTATGVWTEVTDSPAAAQFVAGPPSPLTSTIERERAYVEANHSNPTARGMVDTAVLKVTLRDAFGNLISNPTNTIVVNGSPNGVNLANGGVANNQGDGTYLIEASSDIADTFVFRFTIDGGPNSTDSASVTFVRTPPAPTFDKPKAKANQLTGHTEPNMWVQVVRQDTGQLVCETQANAAGEWTCDFATDLAHGLGLVARTVDKRFQAYADRTKSGDLEAHTFVSSPAATSVKANAPANPIMDPTNGEQITGTVPKYDPTLDGPLKVTITDEDTGAVICTATVNNDGTFGCTPSKPLPNGKWVKATVEDEAGYTSEGRVQVVKRAPKLTVDPSDGTELTGTSDPGNTIVVKDEDGQVVCSTTVGTDGQWKCTPNTPLEEGDIVTITSTDAAGNSTTKRWRIGLPRIVVVVSPIRVKQPETVEGYNFQPGESVTATQYSDPYRIGTAKADSNGQVKWTYAIPVGTDLGAHKAELVGVLSGTVDADFIVIADQGTPTTDRPFPPGQPQPPDRRLPFTGSNDIVGLSGAALGALLAGWLLLLAKRRRREQEEAAATR